MKTGEVSIFRSMAPRVFMTTYFSVILMIFVVALVARPKAAQVPVFLILISIIGSVRAIRSGYVAIYSDHVKIRTLLRQKTIDLNDIDHAEIQEYVQFTSRVRPVIVLKDGTNYKATEFFMQKRLFLRNEEKNKTAKLVEGINQLIGR